MINSRDSYSDFSINKKEIIDVPYSIGTIVELKDNPDILAKICQYRIFVDNYTQVINVGLKTNIYAKESGIDCEISVQELEEKWRKPDRIVFGKLNLDNFTKISGPFEYHKKLKLK